MAEEPKVQWRETTNILFEEVLPTEYKEMADKVDFMIGLLTDVLSKRAKPYLELCNGH